MIFPFRTSAAVRAEHRAIAQARETQAAVAAQLDRIRERDARAARWRQLRDRCAAAALVFGAVFSVLLGNRVPPAIAALFAGSLTLTLAAAALAVELVSAADVKPLLFAIRCAWRGQHQPRRCFLGGFGCDECGARGFDLDAMGFRDQGWVSPERQAFVRTPERVRA